MHSIHDEEDARLMEKLSRLRLAPERSPEKAAAGRLAFLQAAQAISVKAVSGREGLRHSGWTQKIRSIISTNRKEPSTMFTAIATFLAVAALVLGGGGVTVAAAQSSLPDQPLYGVKLWSEDLRSDLTADPLQQTQLSLSFLDERFTEIMDLLNQGVSISDDVNAEFQNQIEETIRLAVSLPEDQAVQEMLEVKTRLENQQQTLLQLMSNGDPNQEAAMLQVRDTIQSRLQVVDQSLPDALKTQDRTQDQIQDQTQDRTQDQTQDQIQDRTQDQLQQMIQQETSKPENAGPQEAPGSENGNGNGNGAQNSAEATGIPVVEATPVPGGNGQGLTTGPSATCTPILLNNGSGNQYQGGQGQQATLTNSNQPADSGSSGSGGKH